MQDAFTVQKSHIKYTVAQKGSALTPIFSFACNSTICIDIKNILYKEKFNTFDMSDQRP